MAEIVLEMKCSLERLREENSRLHEETKTNRLQAQERQGPGSYFFWRSFVLPCSFVWAGAKSCAPQRSRHRTYQNFALVARVTFIVVLAHSRICCGG